MNRAKTLFKNESTSSLSLDEEKRAASIIHHGQMIRMLISL